MKKFIFLICLWLVLCIPVVAGVGSTGANFLKMGGGARARGMGEAQIALADDSSAVFWNPAGLARLQFSEVCYLYDQWYVDITHQYFEAAFPSENGTFGGSYSLLDSGNIQGYDATGARTATFKAQDTALSFSWARKLNDLLSVGINAKSITEKLENYQAISTAVDLGALLNISPRFSCGLAIKNLGQPLKFISEDTPLPQSMGLGIAFKRRIFDDEVILASDYISYSDKTNALNIGLEYLFKDLIALRLGSANGNFRAGVGLWSAFYGLDYAYLAHNELGAAHQVSMSYSFGSRDKRTALVLDYLALGKAYLARDKYAEAIVAFRKVLELNPEHAEGRALLNKVTRALEQSAAGEVSKEIKAERRSKADSFISAGNKFMREEQYLEAIAEFNKALKALPSHPEAVKLVREAQAALEAVVTKQVKREAQEHLGLAMKYISTQQYAEAKNEIEEVLKIDPGNVQALRLYKKLKKILDFEKINQ